MTLPEMSKEQLLEDYKATHRRIEKTSMSASDLYHLIHLDMELEARGLEPVLTFAESRTDQA